MCLIISVIILVMTFLYYINQQPNNEDRTENVLNPVNVSNPNYPELQMQEEESDDERDEVKKLDLLEQVS